MLRARVAGTCCSDSFPRVPSPFFCEKLLLPRQNFVPAAWPAGLNSRITKRGRRRRQRTQRREGEGGKEDLSKVQRSVSDTFLALLYQRNTPSTCNQIGPAQRLLNRRTRSLLPMSAGLLKTSVADEDLTRTKLRL